MDPISIPDRTDTSDPSAIGGLGAAAAAILALLIAFGVDITVAQEVAILRAVAVLAPLGAALWIRRTAWKPESVVKAIDAVEQAVHDGPPEDLSTHGPGIVEAP